jgi:hypothetical protein
MLHREISITRGSENHTKNIYALCRQNMEIFNVKAGGT